MGESVESMSSVKSDKALSDDGKIIDEQSASKKIKKADMPREPDRPKCYPKDL